MATRSYDEPSAGPGRPSPPTLVRAFESARPLAVPKIVELSRSVGLSLGRGPGDEQSSIQDGALALRLETDDEWMSSDHATLRFDDGQWVLADCDSKNGVVVNAVPVTRKALADGDWIRLGATYFVFRDPGVDTRGLGGLSAKLHTRHPALLAELAMPESVAPTAIPMLVYGETGTGKEVLARAVHELSGRTGPFVAVNCGALPANLVESELFGFRRGAFSGAEHDAVGLVRASDGGTLFLDEIAELSEQSQVTLLRALQQGAVRPIGQTSTVPIDLRVIGATHQDLEARIAAGQFREDLYARLVGLVVRLPPLSERREDVGDLVGFHLRQLCPDREQPAFTRAAGAALFEHGWPRNIRELRSALEIATAVADGDRIDLEHLPAELRSGPRAGRPPDSADQKRDAIIASLRSEGGNVSGAARALGYSRAHFHRLMKAFGIDPARYR